jgi:hypothetical protein
VQAIFETPTVADLALSIVFDRQQSDQAAYADPSEVKWK